MINSTYNPTMLSSFDKNGVNANAQGVLVICPAGQTTNIDLTLTDDHLITGFMVLANGSSFGDKVTLQVVAVSSPLPNGMSFPSNTILSQFATNIYIPADKQVKLEENSVYPAKLFAGMTLRMVYTSTGAFDVNVAVNYRLHKVMT